MAMKEKGQIREALLGRRERYYGPHVSTELWLGRGASEVHRRLRGLASPDGLLGSDGRRVESSSREGIMDVESFPLADLPSPLEELFSSLIKHHPRDEKTLHGLVELNYLEGEGLYTCRLGLSLGEWQNRKTRPWGIKEKTGFSLVVVAVDTVDLEDGSGALIVSVRERGRQSEEEFNRLFDQLGRMTLEEACRAGEVLVDLIGPRLE